MISPLDDSIHEGNYSVTINVDGCIQNSIPFEVDVFDDPVVAPSIAPTLLCDGDVLEIQANATGAVSYQWSGPNGFTGNQSVATLTDVNEVLNGLYSVTVTSVSGCTAIGEIAVNTILPPVEPTSITTNGPICEGDDIVLSTSSICVSYQWIGPDGASGSTLANPLLTTTVPTTTIPLGDVAYDAGSWSLICIDANGCESDSGATTELVINEVPQAIATNNGGICPGESVQLLSLIHI